MKETAKKIDTGVYLYRGFRVCREEFYGPEGGLRKCWSIGDAETGFAIYENPQLESLRSAKAWIDAKLAGAYWKRRKIEQEAEPLVWGK
jgi:hypothetical protein